MAQPEVTANTLAAYLAKQAAMDTLRFITCGSVDDGKSTLIGRLLFESKVILDDQLTTLGSDSKKFGTQDGSLDFALLVDGLAAEREQGITIDGLSLLYTTRRHFIVADTPGHGQYTRNMTAGASTAGLAIIIIDAQRECSTRQGVTLSLLHFLASDISFLRLTRWTLSAIRRANSMRL